jgi:adenylate cyclase
MKKMLSVGRRESNDIVLRFENVSGQHCQLSVNYGYWYVKDLNSRNGVKVNNVRIATEKRLDPGDTLAVAKHRYEIRYVPAELGAVGPPPDDESTAKIFSTPLLERAGLSKRKQIQELEQDDDDMRKAYDPEKDEPLMKRPRRPV